MTTTRWVLYDPVADETWTVPINPDQMTSVEGPVKTVRTASGRLSDLPDIGKRAVTFLGKPADPNWSFGGVIRRQSHYQDLLAWVGKTNAIELTDHVGRTFAVYLTAFRPVDRNPTPRVPWRLRYTVEAKILGRIS